MITESVFRIAKMDCPSEEQLIRMSLESIQGIRHLDFRIADRELTIFHEINSNTILERLDTLSLDSSLRSERQRLDWISPEKNERQERRLLWQILGINFFFFVLELTTGWLSNSMGLVADSLDMLADSFVYFLALLAVGKSMLQKQQTAKMAGYLQLLLAVFGLFEVIRRVFYTNELPLSSSMIVVSTLALLGNAACLWLLQRNKSHDAHMEASRIFTSNDIVINLGVMLAGAFVWLTESKYPDLIIGSLVFVIVTKGAIQILKLR